jgi:hypothetical protein
MNSEAGEGLLVAASSHHVGINVAALCLCYVAKPLILPTISEHTPSVVAATAVTYARGLSLAEMGSEPTASDPKRIWQSRIMAKQCVAVLRVWGLAWRQSARPSPSLSAHSALWHGRIACIPVEGVRERRYGNSHTIRRDSEREKESVLSASACVSASRQLRRPFERFS